MGVHSTAGFCAECAAFVWLREDGSCQHGHSPSAISGPYEVREAIVPQRPAVPATRRPKSKRRLILLVVTCAVVALCLLAAGILVAGPLVGKAIRLSGEWRGRLATDYPGWSIKRFDVSGSPTGDSQTAWTFVMAPPGRRFEVGIVYLKGEDGVWTSQDDILRARGSYHGRAESLLDYLQRNYADQGKAVVSVTSTPRGGAVVGWSNSDGVGPVSWISNGSDRLTYDRSADSWSK